MSAQINLFNPAFVRRKDYLSLSMLAQACAGVVLVGGLAGAYLHQRVGKLERDAAQAARLLKIQQDEKARVAAEFVPRQRSAALEAEQTALEADLNAMGRVGALLGRGNFGNNQGYAEYLRAFARQARDGVWLTAFDIVGPAEQIVLQGRALKPDMVPAYIGRLAAEPVLAGKSFAALDISAPRPTAPGGSAPAEAARYVEFTLRSKPGETAQEARP